MRDAGGDLHFIEVKNGVNAGLSPDQVRNLPYLQEGQAVPVGRNAVEAGLEVGEPVRDGDLLIVQVVP